MKRAFIQIRKYWRANLITFIVSLLVFAGIFCAVFFTRPVRNIVAAIDGATIGSISVLGLGLLMWLSHLGTFDLFVFGFRQMGSMLFAKDARRDGHYADYRDDKMTKRSNSAYIFVSVIIAGLLCSISILVLEIIFHALI